MEEEVTIFLVQYKSKEEGKEPYLVIFDRRNTNIEDPKELKKEGYLMDSIIHINTSPVVAKSFLTNVPLGEIKE